MYRPGLLDNVHQHTIQRKMEELKLKDTRITLNAGSSCPIGLVRVVRVVRNALVEGFIVSIPDI